MVGRNMSTESQTAGPTGPEARKALSQALGMSAVNFDRFLAELARAGLARRSGRGGGKAAVALNDQEIAHVLMALSSPYPTGAVDAVRSLRKLWAEPQVGAGSFATELAGTIGTFARAIRNGVNIDEAIEDGWAIIVCLNPLIAWIEWPAINGQQRRKYYREDWTKPIGSETGPIIQRQTVFTKAAIMAAVRLCAADNQASAILVEPLTPGSAKAETADAAPGRAALTRGQGHKIASPGLTNPDATARTKAPQARTRGPDPSSQSPRRQDHERARTAPICAPAG
jgi:hypothetical protein